MPFALQVLMCKTEFLKKSTLKAKQKKRISVLFCAVMDSL